MASGVSPDEERAVALGRQQAAQVLAPLLLQQVRIAIDLTRGSPVQASQTLEGPFLAVSMPNFQLMPHLKALVDIHTTHTFLPISDLNRSPFPFFFLNLNRSSKNGHIIH